MQSRLRVAHVAPGLDMGGLEKLLVEFARHADRRHFDLHFVALGHRGLLADEIEACGWPVTALGMPDKLRPRLALRLARLLRRWGADVVHTHDDRPHLYGTLAGRLAGVRRVVHTRHGRSPNLTRRQKWLVRGAARRVDSFVCVSADSAGAAREHGIPADRLRVILNGIDVGRFPFVGPAAGGPAVLVARLSPEKDVEALLRAASLVVREEPAFRLEIAGDGPCLPDLRRVAAELGLDGSVRFLGQVRDVPGLLARAGMLVLSSLTEGISLTLLEAMASGLPVVATRVGGTPEVVAEGETGLLVPPRDPAALADALRSLWRDPASAARMGSAGRRRAEERFDVRRMVADYETLYRGVNTINKQTACL